MKLKTEVGQIYLTHPKDQNYTALYEEALTKGGETLELFAVLEIDDPGAAAKRLEYERVTQAVVQTLKKTYIAAHIIDGESFEKALAAVNAALGRLARGGKMGWLQKLHIALGVLYKNELSIACVGHAQVFLLRGGELANLSEDLAPLELNPVKIFASFTSGRLTGGDRVIISTNQLLNYLSIERLQEFLSDDSLSGACQEIIAALADIKTAGFATFIFELNGPRAKTEAPADAIPTWTPPPRRGALAKNLAAFAGQAALSLLKFLWWGTKKIWQIVAGLFGGETGRSPRRKKIIALAAGALVLLLLINIGVGAVRRAVGNKTAEKASAATAIESKLNDADAALIYGDDDRAATLVSDAEELLKNFTGSDEQKTSLSARLTEVKNKVSRVTAVDNPTVLTTFPNIPTDLIHSAQGFLGFNSDTGSLAFYNFTLAETRAVLKGQSTSDLSGTVHLGNTTGYVFLTKTGKFFRLNLTADTLEPYGSTEGDGNIAHARSFTALGQETAARMYILGQTDKDIWRVGVADNLPALSQKWLKEEADFSDAKNIAVDGSIYVLFGDRLDKYFNGIKQTFALPAVLPQLNNAAKVYTSAELESLYILDPSNQRILVFTKAGKLSRQITSPKFKELTDIYVDEPNKLLYVLAGGELLKISY